VVFSSSFAPFLELSRLPLGLGRALQAAKQTFSLLDEIEPLRNEGSSEIEKINEEIGISIDGEEGDNERVEVKFIGDKLKIFRK